MKNDFFNEIKLQYIIRNNSNNSILTMILFFHYLYIIYLHFPYFD